MSSSPRAMESVKSIAVVTFALALAGAVAGAICGLLALSPVAVQHWVWPTGDDGLIPLSQIAPLVAGIGATIGMVIGPVLAWGLLRSVRLWRVVAEPAFGAVLGSFAGWGVASVGFVPGISAILGGGVVGALAAGVLLRRRASRLRESTP